MRNIINSEAVLDEDNSATRFTLFDVNMPKKKTDAKKFKLEPLR